MHVRVCMRIVYANCNGSCDVRVRVIDDKWHLSKRKSLVDLDLAFCRSDTTILHKRHIAHENKAVSCENHGL